MAMTLDQALDTLVRSVEDWPEPGVTFRDVTPLLADGEAMRVVVDGLAALGRDLAGTDIDKVIGIEARGFIFGAAVAYALGAGFVPARKAGKLPAATYSESYDLEYGSATLEIHRDAVAAGDRVLVVDDVLATGGTMAAVDRLIAQAGAKAAANVVVIELDGLGGRRFVDETQFGSLRRF